jgi:hypothetical protein
VEPLTPEERKRNRDWHRLFALMLHYRLIDTPLEVETEIDVTKQIQALDILVVRRSPGEINVTLPDGFSDLAKYNLISFKSIHEALDKWAIRELSSHYVGFRKLVSGSKEYVDENEFRLFAICARSPQKLKRECQLQVVSPGVYYEPAYGIQIIVVAELPTVPHNSQLFFFAAQQDLLQYGKDQIQGCSDETSRFLNVLLERISGDQDMKIDADKWLDEMEDEMLQRMPVNKRLKGLRPEEVFQNFRPEDRLQGLRPEDRLQGLRPEELDVLKKYLLQKDNPQ